MHPTLTPNVAAAAALILSSALLTGCSGSSTEAGGAEPAAATDSMTTLPADSVYAVQTKTLAGADASLADYAGDVTVFVNVASKCGYTPQYAGLQALSEEMKGSGVRVVGVPSNDFGGQEPGTADEIATFCSENYGVTFEMLEKQGTKDGDSPLFDSLASLTGERPGWNFCKYVVSKDGAKAQFFASGVTPDSAELKTAIQGYLAE
ncbi:MAG: glutathione peroxidase [Planctomycetota bacterium]